MNPLEVEGLGVRLGGRAILEDVSFTVAAGEVVGLIGPNGAGKSTLVWAVAGLVARASGRVSLCGSASAGLSVRERARRVAMVPQGTELDFAFSVAEVVMMGRHPHLRRLQLEGQADQDVVTEALEEVGLSGLAGREIGSLSGGERQLVFLAKAVAQRTPVLLLDEPISALDLARQLEALDLVQRLRGEGRAVLTALHDLDLAARYCDRLLVLDRGRLVAQGRPQWVLTAELLADVYRIRAEVETDRHTGRPRVHVLSRLTPKEVA